MATIYEDETTIIVINFKYDKERTRKVFADIIIVDEKPFRHVESRLFKFFCGNINQGMRGCFC